MAGQPCFELQLAGQPKTSKQVFFPKDMKRQKQQETKKVEWWLDSHMLGQSARVECGGWIAIHTKLGCSG